MIVPVLKTISRTSPGWRFSLWVISLDLKVTPDSDISSAEEIFKSGSNFSAMQMKEIRNEDEAVSPIIATILLIAITVTIIASAYTVFSGYIPSTAPEGPSVNIIYTNETHYVSGAVYGNYVMTLSEITNNISLKSLSAQVVLQNGSTYQESMYDSYVLGTKVILSPGIYLNVSMPGGYLSSNGYVVLNLSGSHVFPSLLSIVDNSSGNRVGTISFQ